MLSARGVSRASAILPSFHLKQFITFTNPVLIHKFLQCEILQRVLHGKSAFSGLTLATDFTLWCKFVLLEEQVSEREFNEMSIDEKLDILQGCFGHEIHSFPPPPTAAVTPRLRSG